MISEGTLSHNPAALTAFGEQCLEFILRKSWKNGRIQPDEFRVRRIFDSKGSTATYPTSFFNKKVSLNSFTFSFHSPMLFRPCFLELIVLVRQSRFAGVAVVTSVGIKQVDNAKQAILLTCLLTCVSL